MSELRWILLIAGFVLIIGIVIYSRMAGRNRVTRAELRREPSFSTTTHNTNTTAARARAHTVTDVASVQEKSARLTGADSENEEAYTTPLYSQNDLPLENEPDIGAEKVSAAPKDEKIVAIHVAARAGRRFAGPAILEAMATESLEFGEFQVFHRRTGNRAIFSLSSMVEPGRFDLEQMDTFTTPGLTLFMVVPGPESPVATFTEMLSTARRLATVLDAEVLDESGSTLSRQAASHLREQIIEFAHRVR